MAQFNAAEVGGEEKVQQGKYFLDSGSSRLWISPLLPKILHYLNQLLLILSNTKASLYLKNDFKMKHY